jgi:hypothetical protein
MPAMTAVLLHMSSLNRRCRQKNPASRELVYATAGADLQVILDDVRERLRAFLADRVVPQLQRAQRVIPPERTGQSCDALRAHVVAAHVQRHQ